MANNDITVANPNSGTVSISGITVDSAGDVFLVGNIVGTASFGGQTIHSNASSTGSGFVAKLSSTGVGDWAQVLGGPNSGFSDTASGIAVSSDGSNVYVGVNYAGTLDLPGTSATLTGSVGAGYSAVLQLNGTTGATNYDIQLGTNSSDNSQPVNQIELDNSGNLYVTGGFYDTIPSTGSAVASTFTGGGSTGSIVVPANSSYHGQALYVLKATASTGALNWVTPVNASPSSGDLNGSAIAVNNSGTIFMVGGLGSSNGGRDQFGAASNAPTLASTSNNFSGFVGAINSTGTFQWEEPIQGGAVTLGGSSVYGAIFVDGVAVDSSGDPIITGSFQDGAVLNPGTTTQQTLAAKLQSSSLSGATRAFVEKFNTSGTSQWVTAEGGTNGSTYAHDIGNQIIVDGSGNVVAAGDLRGNTGGNSIFGSGSTVTSPGAVTNAYMWTLNDSTGATDFAGSFPSSVNSTDGGLSPDGSGSLIQIALNTGGVVDIDPTSATNNVSASASGGIIAVSLTDTGSAGCFAAGTRIATVDGEVAVEDLREGDLVISHLSGQAMPVRWIGSRFVDCTKHPRPGQVWPVRVRAGAFGPGAPIRDLYLSPDHAVFVDGVLVPVHFLINGTSIAVAPVDAVTYYHIALAEHDVVIANGLAAESYLDVGDRREFDNGGGIAALFADFSIGREGTPLIWETRGCARLVMTGAELSAIRARLAPPMTEAARAA